MPHKGFTLVELITVIVLLGILAVYAAPRFFTSGDADVVAAQASVAALLRMQQQRAMQDTVNSLAYGVDFAKNGNILRVTPIAPDEAHRGEPLEFAGLELEGTSEIRFNALGCSSLGCGGAPLEIRLRGSSVAGNRFICINQQGYINNNPC